MKKYLPVFEKLLFWLAMGLLVFIPLYPKFPLVTVTGTFAAIRLEDILIAATLTLWGVYILVSGKLWEYLNDRLYQTFLLFFGIGLLSVFSAAYVTHTIDLHLGILHYLRRVEMMALLPLMATVVNTRKQVKQILVVLSIVTFIVCFYAVGQQYFHLPLVSTTNSEFAKGQVIYLTPAGRVNSTFAGHYDLAIFLMMVICIVTATIFSYGFVGASSDNPRLAQWKGEFKGLLYLYRKNYGLIGAAILKIFIYLAIILRMIGFSLLGKMSFVKTYEEILTSI